MLAQSRMSAGLVETARLGRQTGPSQRCSSALQCLGPRRADPEKVKTHDMAPGETARMLGVRYATLFNAAESGLLGAGHQALVSRLLNLLDQVVAGNNEVPRVVLLTGEQGTGKSRIVREVYRVLQAAQPAPAYWPTLPSDLFQLKCRIFGV